MTDNNITNIHPKEVANKSSKENLKKAINMALQVESEAIRLNTQTFNKNRYSAIAKLDDYGRSMEIQLKEQSDPQEILQAAAGRIRINRFEVQEPTLNAIFIDKVGGSHE